MEPKQSDHKVVMLGALLHDIGKFVQRSQENPRSKNHSQWGEEWFVEHLAEKMSPALSESDKQTIIASIGNHHGYEKYISLADGISAGMDRVELEDEEKGDPFTDRLISIFSNVSLSDKQKMPRYHRFAPLGQEGLKETIPVGEKKCSFRDYADLLKGLEREINNLDFEGFSIGDLIDFLTSLLWKYCWCIPSAVYRHEPDISLFDHLKTTAAIAGCLCAYEMDTDEHPLTTESEAFCLIGGDISGIQNFIFDVLTQQGKVAKRLRARSLYTQLVSEIASHRVLQAFDLPLCNILSSAGGNFYILVPNLKEARSRLEGLQEEFDKWLLSHLSGELSVSLASVELSGKDLADFSQALDILKSRLGQNKYRPYRLALTSNGAWLEEKFVMPVVVEGDEGVCQGCHKFPRDEKAEEMLCERCSADTAIGQFLPRREYIAFFDDEKHDFKVLNYSFELWDDEHLKNMHHKAPYQILRLNNPDD